MRTEGDVKRALLIGSEVAGLTGVHRDVAAMAEVLGGNGFTTVVATGGDATADGIVGQLRDLAADTAEGDAAVVYYSGHGSRVRNEAPEPGMPRWLQFIVPTDYADRSGARARVVLAEELSLLQLELTSRTPNVTSIYDCCHSARMSRDATLIPRALDGSGLPGRRHRASLAGAAGRAVAGGGRSGRQPGRRAGGGLLGRRERLRDAERDRSAGSARCADRGARARAHPYRGTDADLGATCSASSVARRWTWRRSDPRWRARRTGWCSPPSSAARPVCGRSASQAGQVLLDGVTLFGIVPGDTYAIVPPGGDVAAPLSRATVERVVDGAAVLRLEPVPAMLPPGTLAWPREVALGARPVAVVPTDAPWRPEIVAALDRTKQVRVVDDPAGALATVRLDGPDVQVLDAAGAPLYGTVTGRDCWLGGRRRPTPGPRHSHPGARRRAAGPRSCPTTSR